MPDEPGHVGPLAQIKELQGKGIVTCLSRVMPCALVFIDRLVRGILVREHDIRSIRPGMHLSTVVP